MKTKNLVKRLDEIDVAQAQRGRPGPFYSELMTIARTLVAKNKLLKTDLETEGTCHSCGGNIGGICSWCA